MKPHRVNTLANPSKDSVKPIPLTHLSDQVAVSKLRDGLADGSALMVLLAVYRAFAVLDRDQAEELSTLGLTPLQFNILTTLKRTQEPTTMGALASLLVVRPNNLSGNINTLIQRGWVRREINSLDQRSFLAVITDKGHSLLDQHLPAHWVRLEKLMSELSNAKRRSLVEGLKLMVSSVEKNASI